MEIFILIEGRYNPRRRRAGFGYLSNGVYKESLRRLGHRPEMMNRGHAPVVMQKANRQGRSVLS